MLPTKSKAPRPQGRGFPARWFHHIVPLGPALKGRSLRDTFRSKILEPFSSSVVYTCETEKTGKEETEMHLISKGFLPFIFAMALFSSVSAQGQPMEETNKTLSPYFFVKSDDASVDQLPLKSTSADVKVTGVIADVVVTQIYKNEGKKPLEAIYIFPASTRAAVHGMKMTIGKRTIIAKIQERKEARRQYEEAKQQGRSASLLEQQRPNVFQMNVANILPGDLIQVELKYTELLVPTDGIYEFVYPTVVGPRYSNQPAETALPSHKWVENPYLHQGESPTYTFDITVDLSAGLPIQNIACTSHKVDIHYDGPSRARMKLDTSEKSGGNRDFILKYQLAGSKVQSGLLLFEGEKENFFLLTLQPPKRVKTNQIPPREYIFIVDVSGSMYGFPLDMSKKLLKDLIGNLRPADKFNVLLFSGGSSLMSEQSLPATSENIRRAIDLIERQHGGGGTELLPALKRALSLARSEGYSRSVVVATDGYVTVEEEVFDLMRKNLGNANMFTFGIGSSVNRHLLEGMARVGTGEPFVISKPEETREKAEKFRKMIESPVLTRVKVDFGKFNVYAVEPLGIPDVFAERPIIVFGKWRGRPGGEITLSGMTVSGPYVDKIDIRKEKPIKSNSALQYLWARYRITLLSDYNFLHQDDARIKEVTQLGLSYNLLTAYTSFVAIDTEVRLVDGQAVTVKQPLPLPEGVSDYAVGKGMVAQKAMAPLAALRFGGMDKSQVREECRDERFASKPARVFVELGEINAIAGGLSKESLQNALKRLFPSIELYYQKALEKNPDIQGEATFQLTIDSKGRLAKVSLLSSKLNDKRLEQFIIQKLKESTFPAPQGTDTVTATVSIRLTT
jgi:Ca-activated chloride channel family protein